MYTITVWPIIIAALVAFGIGALWYSPILFGREWMRLSQTSDADVAAARSRGMWKPYLSQFLASIVTFAVLAFFVASSNAVTSVDGAFLGAVAWLGFIAPLSLSSLLWKQEPFKLVLIDTVCTLVTFVVGGAIIGAWK